MDISQALAADSDEMVAADLIGSPPRIFTIAEVDEVVREGKTVARVRLVEFPRPWLASKGMARVMADNWTVETQNWIGRKVELYGDPDVYFGKEKTGGIRISRLSHISKPRTTRINPRSGRNASWTVDPLPDAPAEPTPQELAEQLVAALADATTEAEVREWGNRAHARGLLDLQVNGATVKNLVTSRLTHVTAEDPGGAA